MNIRRSLQEYEMGKAIDKCEREHDDLYRMFSERIQELQKLAPSIHDELFDLEDMFIQSSTILQETTFKKGFYIGHKTKKKRFLSLLHSTKRKVLVSK